MPQRRCAWARMASSRCRSAPATRAKPSAGKLRPLDHLETVWKALGEGPQRLTQREVSALAGEAYRDVKGSGRTIPGPAMCGGYLGLLLLGGMTRRPALLFTRISRN